MCQGTLPTYPRHNSDRLTEDLNHIKDSGSFGFIVALQCSNVVAAAVAVCVGLWTCHSQNRHRRNRDYIRCSVLHPPRPLRFSGGLAADRPTATVGASERLRPPSGTPILPQWRFCWPARQPRPSPSLGAQGLVAFPSFPCLRFRLAFCASST